MMRYRAVASHIGLIYKKQTQLESSTVISVFLMQALVTINGEWVRKNGINL